MTGSAVDMVSVCMITYNHEEYISQAIEGVLMQKTSFPIEVIIGEDHSTDRTAEICKKFETLYSDKIHLTLREQNIGIMPNFIDTLKSCRGKYIAICEGDDYWTDINKLQKQVDFLENNKDYIASSHNVKLIHEIVNTERLWHTETTERDISFKETVEKGNQIVTLSLVFRNDKDIISEIESVNKRGVPAGDYLLNLFLAKKGKMKYFPHVMGSYRVNSNGWSANFYNLDKSIVNYENYIFLVDSLSSHFQLKKKFKVHKVKIIDRLRLYYALAGQKKSTHHTSIFLLKNIFKYKDNKFRLFCSIVFSFICYNAFRKRVIKKHKKRNILVPNGGI